MTSIPSSLRPTASPLALTWDFDNKLRAADTDNDGIDDVVYTWDALGRRVGRDDGTTHTLYFQDGQQTLADYPAGAAAGSPAYTYVYGSYIDEVVLRSGSGGLRYYHRNQQYSITALTDVGGAVVERYGYTAYGQATFADASGTVQAASASNNRYTYTGREWDAGLSLYHYRARMYDAVAGRFVSRDPAGLLTTDIYLYCKSNPLKYTDSSGNIPVVVIPIAGGAIALTAAEAAAAQFGLSVIACAAFAPCRDAMLQAIKTAIDAMDAATRAALRAACQLAHETYHGIEDNCRGCLPKKGKTCLEQFRRCAHAGSNYACWKAAMAARGAYIFSGCDYVWPSNPDRHIGAMLQDQDAANNCAESAANNCWGPILTGIGL